MLAAFSNYLFAWQLPMFAVFGATWLIGGPYLTRRALARYADLPRSKRHLGRCAQLNLFATGAGLVALLIVAAFIVVMARSPLGVRLAVAVGVAVGLPSMLGMSWVISLSILALPSKTVLRIAASTTGPIMVLLLLVAAGAGVPAWFVRQNQILEEKCRYGLHQLRYALDMHSRRGEEALSLQALVEAGLLKSEFLVCPGKPDVETGYVYLPATPATPGKGSEKIRLCDRRGNHGSKRHVLFIDGRLELLGRREFDELLAKPENEDFRKKLIETEP